MITLLKVTIFNAGFWIGGALFSLAVVGYLYSVGNDLSWKK
ncbi:MAG: hypothetical protein WC433_07740 [Candidatus Omnitrophota bacterium]|jgi:Cft2 family RNA processing exonuclease